MNKKISSSDFYSKIQELIKVPQGVTPEVLSAICDDDSVQPFLQWFTTSITPDNIVSDEDLKLIKHIEETRGLLHGDELDKALAEETKDCPELIQLLNSDYWNTNQAKSDYVLEKALYDQDLEYYQELEASLRELEEIEDKLDAEIATETEEIQKEEIKINLIREKCLIAVEECDAQYRQFHDNVESLAKIYQDALEKKGEPFIWSQMPIDQFIRQMDTYTEYLHIYAKQIFEQYSKEDSRDEGHIEDFLSDNNDVESLNELMMCQKRLFTSEIDCLMSRVDEKVWRGLLNFIKEIYNDGELKIPSSEIVARTESAEMVKELGILQEKSRILQDRTMVDVVHQHTKGKIVKILEDEAKVRLQRRKKRLENLEELVTLTKERGFAFTTLLCMLMELQIHQINEVVQFVLDSRHFLSQEYGLSSVRTEAMKSLMKEYQRVISSPKESNAFNKVLSDMASLAVDADIDVEGAKKLYDQLTIDNCVKLKSLLEDHTQEAIKQCDELAKNVTLAYNAETSKDPTRSFKTIPYNIQNIVDKIPQKIAQLEEAFAVQRNELKKMKNAKPSLEREKLIMWQRFLADPESLPQRIQDLEEAVKRSNF